MYTFGIRYACYKDNMFNFNLSIIRIMSIFNIRSVYLRCDKTAAFTGHLMSNSQSPFQKQTTIMILLNRDPKTFHNNLFFTIVPVAIVKIDVHYKKYVFF